MRQHYLLDICAFGLKLVSRGAFQQVSRLSDLSMCEPDEHIWILEAVVHNPQSVFLPNALEQVLLRLWIVSFGRRPANHTARALQ